MIGVMVNTQDFHKDIRSSKTMQQSFSNRPLIPGIILESHYKIISLIKAGGMGAIYKALDERLDSIVAIKELIPPFGDQQQQKESTDWFKREAKLLAKLDHANLPKVSDYFVSGSRYYLVMTFVDGEDLEVILKREGKPGLLEEKVIELTKQVLVVLDYLHNQKPPIVYRDIKPANIMLHKDGRVMLIDFGIARTIQQGSQTTKTVIGTPGYAPVEQFKGKVETRSDIYSLGVTMHHLLTGLEPVPFKFEPLRKINKKISPELESIIMKTLKDDLRERFSSAKEMIESLNFDNADNWNKGIAIHKQGKVKEAIKCYDKALEIEPRHKESLYNKKCAIKNQISIKNTSYNNKINTFPIQSFSQTPCPGSISSALSYHPLGVVIAILSVVFLCIFLFFIFLEFHKDFLKSPSDKVAEKISIYDIHKYEMDENGDFKYTLDSNGNPVGIIKPEYQGKEFYEKDKRDGHGYSW